MQLGPRRTLFAFVLVVVLFVLLVYLLNQNVESGP